MSLLRRDALFTTKTEVNRALWEGQEKCGTMKGSKVLHEVGNEICSS